MISSRPVLYKLFSEDVDSSLSALVSLIFWISMIHVFGCSADKELMRLASVASG